MKLCYRGIAYERPSLEVPTITTKTTGKFRGCSHTFRQPAVNVPTKDKSGLIYRGVSESEGTQGRFLGRSYSLRRVFIVPSNA